MTDSQADRQKVKETIRNIQNLKEQGLLPAKQAEAGIAALQDQLMKLAAKLDGDGAIAQGTAANAIRQQGVMVDGNAIGDIVTGDQNTIVIHKKK